ncbi:MAG TPA: hypothetical protein VFD82_17160 [Planctomycetota bacterium]|nr:hypothetical protein [Planctomycetota bacterium]
MSSRSLLSMTFACFCAAPMLAQASPCPMEKTKHVPLDVFYGPSQDCGGFTYSVGGVTIGANRKGCPLFIIVTPPHEIAEPSSQETKVQVTANLPISMVTFTCTTDWILIIPIGSSCTLDRSVNLGTVQSMITVPCYTVPPSGN